MEFEEYNKKEKELFSILIDKNKILETKYNEIITKEKDKRRLSLKKEAILLLCHYCKDVIISKNQHPLTYCSCHSIGIDSGQGGIYRIMGKNYETFQVFSIQSKKQRKEENETHQLFLEIKDLLIKIENIRNKKNRKIKG